MTGSIQAWTMDDEGELRYGQSHINVYLPREQPYKEVPPPSPVFDLDNIYKFSDEVQKDRHLFNFGRKAFLHLYSKHNSMSNDKNNSKSSEEEKEDDFSEINVVRLRLDSAKSDTTSYRSSRMRFNERLSAYVTTKKKVQSNQTSERTLNTPRKVKKHKEDEKETFLLPKAWDTAQSRTTTATRKVRKGFRYRTAKSSTTGSPLPPLGPHQRSISKRDNLNTERTMWFPDAASPINTQYSRLPTRPSSKPHKIWRQSSDILLGRKTPSITDLVTDNIPNYKGNYMPRQNSLI